MASRRDREEQTRILPRAAIARRQHAALYLSLAALAFCLRATTLVIPPQHAVAQATRDAIATDAHRLAVHLDAALIRATERAQGLASSPVLQAGILTDAATLEDIVATELDIRTRPGETLELFQVRGDTATSLVRVPADATPIARVPGARARIADRNGLAVVAVAPVVPYTKAADVAGELVVAASVDLSTLQLAHTTLGARLVAAAAAIPLVVERASVDGTFEVPVPIDPRWQLGALSLEAVPVLTASRESWLLPVRYAALGLGIVFLTAFVCALRGARRR